MSTAVQNTTPPSGLSEFWFYFSRNKGAVIGLFIFLVILFLAVFAPFVAPHNPSVQGRDVLLLPPVFSEGGGWGHILGTDAVGRDILSRLIYGARFSLFIGLVVVTLSVVSGVTHSGTGFVPCKRSVRSGLPARPGRSDWPDQELDHQR